MASLSSLPFEVQLQIVSYLNLRDRLAFAQVSVASHDVVYYVLSHHAELDFSSVIMDNEGYVSLIPCFCKFYMLTLELLV